jgi:hypothetical protein
VTQIAPSTLTVTPVNLLEIVEIIGEAAALKLVEQFGGTTPRLPAIKNISADHPLAQCIGIEALTALAKETGGGRWLYVARCANGLREARNREIVRLYSPPYDVPVAELARRYHLSDRQIWNILGSTVVDDKQVSLF